MISRNAMTIKYDSIHNILQNFNHVYLVTIAKHQVKDYVTKEDLDNIHVTLRWRLTDMYIPVWAYEISQTYKQLHLHGIALTKRAVYFKENNSMNGFRIQWVKCYNLEGALGYIFKDAKNKYLQEQILDINYYNHNYGFF